MDKLQIPNIELNIELKTPNPLQVSSEFLRHLDTLQELHADLSHHQGTLKSVAAITVLLGTIGTLFTFNISNPIVVILTLIAPQQLLIFLSHRLIKNPLQVVRDQFFNHSASSFFAYLKSTFTKDARHALYAVVGSRHDLHAPNVPAQQFLAHYIYKVRSYDTPYLNVNYYTKEALRAVEEALFKKEADNTIPIPAQYTLWQKFIYQLYYLYKLATIYVHAVRPKTAHHDDTTPKNTSAGQVFLQKWGKTLQTYPSIYATLEKQILLDTVNSCPYGKPEDDSINSHFTHKDDTPACAPYKRPLRI